MLFINIKLLLNDENIINSVFTATNNKWNAITPRRENS